MIADHHAIVTRFWTPDRVSYTGLGQMYVDDPRCKARYDDRHLALAVYLRDATSSHSDAQLD